VKPDQFKHFEDMFTNGGHYPTDENKPVVSCEVCDKSNGPRDGHGHDKCRSGAEVAHRLYFKDRDKPLINNGK